MPMTIPEIRDELMVLFTYSWCPREIAERGEALVKEMHRRKPVRVAPPASRTATRELYAEIREFAKTHPTWTQQKISERFKVTAGRVSEALRGKRK